ncbi:MAG: adenylate/guanylate cyclase domain-containing protein [Flavisolibacter sp.]|nr:adenylate/guanylate cyclase domain-containing protein [Flavisolibacter sp.]
MSEASKYFIEFPKEGCVYASPNQTILEAALSAGVPLFHVCGGKAKCSTCRVLVIEGAEWLTPPNAKEKLLNDQMHFPRNVRLACQTHITGGSIKLARIIQDETDIGIYVGNSSGASSQQIGEERELVLFFLDIRNFTPLVEKLLPFDTIHIIRKLFLVFQNIIESNQGKIIETTGDGLYAVFGCDTGRVQSVQSAVKAASTILEDLVNINDSYFKIHFHENIQVGIGIHIGRVVSGVIRIGNEERMIVMGYPVNIASRLQNATKFLNNSLVVSSDIYGFLSDPPSSEPLTITLKGIENEQKVYLLGQKYS